MSTRSICSFAWTNRRHFRTLFRLAHSPLTPKGQLELYTTRQFVCSSQALGHVPLGKTQTDSSGITIKVDRTTRDVQDEITTNGDLCDEVALSFQSLKGRVNHDTLKALTTNPFRFETMTSVQQRVTALLPNLVHPWDPEGVVPSTSLHPIDWSAPRNILVRAKTGTGKTIAYIIPAIESRLNHVEHHAQLAVINAGHASSPEIARSARLAYRRRSVGPLILAPTRELAIQIASCAQKLTAHQRGFEVQLLVGGAGKSRQLKDWSESTRDLVVATPGRLRDLLVNESEFRSGFKSCPMLILDEADTLLSMGFRDDIDAIASYLPRSPVQQTFLVSATLPRAVRQLASWLLSPNHTFIDATQPSITTPENEEFTVASNTELTTHGHIEQFYTLCPTASDQLPTLLKLLAHDQLTHGSSSKVIVFCPTIQATELFSMLLRSLAEEVLPDHTTEIATMHSKMKQSERDRTRVLFHKAGKTRDSKPIVLVSSDVSARGVDYPGVTRVIQIGIPNKEAMYIHRIGRMARGADSFEPQQGSAPVLHADLLLLPWEAAYMNWQLTSLPIKPLSIPALDEQLASFAPQSPKLDTKCFQSAFTEIRRRINPADIRSTAASLLGYYLPLTPSLRMQPNDVVASVSSWASECFHVSIPTLARLPRKFVEAYEQSTQSTKTKGLYVDGLKIPGPSPLGKAKSKNRSVWEGAKTQKRKPKRWY